VPLNEGLERAGRLIGVLERILVLIFILFDQFSAIGLLLASKSILRISREDDKEARTKTEYVLVGTLLSFLAATAIGIVAKTLI
jgi:nucleoside permease NupC